MKPMNSSLTNQKEKKWHIFYNSHKKDDTTTDSIDIWYISGYHEQFYAYKLNNTDEMNTNYQSSFFKNIWLLEFPS